MTISEAIEAINSIVDCYPNGGKGADDGYIGALASVLVDYPLSISLKAADTRRGVAASSKFLPTVYELIQWLDAESEKGEAVRAYPLLNREAPVNRSKRINYEQLKTKYGDGKGGWGTNTEPKSYTEMFKKYGRPIGRFERAGDQWNRF